MALGFEQIGNLLTGETDSRAMRRKYDHQVVARTDVLRQLGLERQETCGHQRDIIKSDLRLLKSVRRVRYLVSRKACTPNTLFTQSSPAPNSGKHCLAFCFCHLNVL